MHIVYGGAFNPPTVAHLEVYHYIKKHLEVTKFTYLPVSSAYTKSSLASNHHRLNMLKAMVKPYSDIEISELEIRDQEFKGTYYSLVRLADYTDKPLAFVIGADNLETIPNWVMPQSLLSEFKIIVLSRNSIDLEAIIDANPILKQHKSAFIILDDFDYDVSSTLYRKTKEPSLVPSAVQEYIVDHELYEE